MTTERKEFSFLPDDFHDRNVRRRLTAAAVAILAILGIATFTALYVAEQSLQHVKRRNAEATQAFDRAVAGGERAAAIKDQGERLLEHARRMTALTAGIPSSGILDELTTTLPPGTTLTSLSIVSIAHPAAAGVTPTAFDQKKAALDSKPRAGAQTLPEVQPTDIVVKMSGVADTNTAVSQFCDSLSRSPIFQEVHLLGSEISAAPGNAKGTTRSFQIEITLKPSAGIIRTIPDLSTASIIQGDEENRSRSKETP